MNNFVTIIRLILTAAILVLVCRHAHWSVGTAIVLLTLSNEMIALSLRKMREDIDRK